MDGYIAYLAKNNPDWQKASRNAKGGVTTLRDEIQDLLAGSVTEETRILRALLIEHRYASIQRIFGGRKIVIKRREMPPMVQKVQSAQEKAGLMADALGLVTDIIKKVAGEAASPAEVPKIIEILGNQFLNNLALAAMPFLGGAQSGVKAVAKGYDAIRRTMQGSAVKTKHMQFTLPGNARAAAEALVELLRRQRNDSAAKAGIYTASAALQISGNFFPGGNFVGTAAKIAESFGLMVMDAYTAAQEVREIGAANIILGRGAKDLCESVEIFQAYPLIGAYFVVFGNTNDILSVLSREIGTLHWRQVVADIKERHLRPMREMSNDFIQMSRFELQGLHVPAGGFLGLDGRIERAQEALSKLLDKHVLGNDLGTEFVRAAQPFITTPEALAEVRQKAASQLDGRKGWTTDDLGRSKPVVAADTRSRAQIMADLRAPITPGPRGGGRRYSADV